MGCLWMSKNGCYENPYIVTGDMVKTKHRLRGTGAKSQGIKQLMAGGGIVLIGLKLIPLLSNVLK